jgi:hypothetical protein
VKILLRMLILFKDQSWYFISRRKRGRFKVFWVLCFEEFIYYLCLSFLDYFIIVYRISRLVRQGIYKWAVLLLILVYLLWLRNVQRRRSREFTYRCLDFICWSQVNLWSNVSSRYFTALAFGIKIPYMQTVGPGVSLRVNVHCIVLERLIFNRHLMYQSSIKERWFKWWREAITRSSLTEIIILSSAHSGAIYIESWQK